MSGLAQVLIFGVGFEDVPLGFQGFGAPNTSLFKMICITFFYWKKIDSGRRRRGRQWERRTSQWMCKTRLCGPLLNLTACKDYKGRSNQSKKDNILTYTTRTHLSIQRRISLEHWSIYAEKTESSAFSLNRKLSLLAFNTLLFLVYLIQYIYL